MIKIERLKTIINCPSCHKEYNIDEFEKLKKVKSKPIITVRGKQAPKKAISEIAKYTNGVLHEEHVDIFNDNVYNARICIKCGTEFGYVKIIKHNDNTIYGIDLDLMEKL